MCTDVNNNGYPILFLNILRVTAHCLLFTE
jgi:hypothetical protein